MVSLQMKQSKLINDSFDVCYINCSTSSSIEQIGRFSIIKIIRFFCALLETFSHLILHNYDLCYLAITCHGSGFLKDAPFVLLCKLFRRKIIIHHHNKGMSSDVDRWPYRLLLPLVYRNVRVVILSWRLYSDIERVVAKEQVAVCPNGITDASHLVVNDNHSIPRLLFLSNMLISKGVFVLLDALHILSKTGIRFKCRFVGAETKEIDATRFKQEVADRDLEDFVEYLGQMVGEEKYEVISSSDVFLFPTTNECFGLVLLEAMQFSLPIVATDEGGIPDIVQNGVTGLICRKNDPGAFAECIKKLLEDPKMRRQMGENGRSRFHSHYTEDIFLSRMHKIWTESTCRL